MFNLISAAKGKLDDPILQEWAIRFYSKLPRNALAERKQIETDWFHEFFLAQIIERGDTAFLKRLFRTLPPQHFSSLQHLIVKNWSTWPASVISVAADVLAVTAPEQLIQLYLDDLAKLKQGANIDPLKFSSIDHLPTDWGNAPLLVLIDQLAYQIPAWQEPISKALVISALLKFARQLSTDNLEALLDVALQLETSENRRLGIFQRLFLGLFGHNDYLAMVFDREQYESPLKLAALVVFFADSAPLAQFEAWLAELPSSKDILPLLETLKEESPGCQIVLHLLKDSKRITSKLSSKLQAQLALAACIHGYAKSTLDPAAFDVSATLNLLVIDLERPRWHSLLTEHLKTLDVSSVSAALIARLSENDDDFAAVHIAEAMGELAYPAFVEPLIVAIGENKGDYLCEAARLALSNIGNPAQAALIAQWDALDRSQKIYGLSVIQGQHNQVTADFATSRFAQLLSDDLESACELILAAPSALLLELLKPELRRNQSLLDRAFYVSAKLLDYKGAEVDAAKERTFAEHQRVEQAMADFESGDMPQNDHLFLELECPACGAVNRYQAKGVVVTADNQSTLLADEFPCASCNEYVEFNFTAMAKMAVFAELVKLTALNNGETSTNQTIKTMDCRLDGHVMPLATAITTVRSRLDADPQNAREWFRLGNLFSNINRPKASITAYRNAVKFAPTAVDAQFALAHTLTENQQEVEAFKLLQTALEQSASWSFLGEFPNFGNAFSDLYNHLRRQLGKHNVPALHPSIFSSPKKLGRNDPCSCGSGKKYKKCCGR
jgi:thioredoxin-like negative regulator of GroEL